MSRANPQILAFALAVVVGGAPTNAAAAPDREDLFKAAIVYNFTRFTTWPPHRMSGPAAPVVVCVDQSDPFAAALESIDGKPVGERRLVVRRLKQPFTAACHMAWFSQAPDAEYVAALHRQGILTVSDAPGFSRVGCFGLVKVGRQIRFEINNQAARRSGATLSSKLLRLSMTVR